MAQNHPPLDGGIFAQVLDPRRIDPTEVPPCYFLVDADDWIDHIWNRYAIVDTATSQPSKESLKAMMDVVVALVQQLLKLGIRPLVFITGGPRPDAITKFGTRRIFPKFVMAYFKHAVESTATRVTESVADAAIDILGFITVPSWQQAGRAPYFVYGSVSSGLWVVAGASFIQFDTVETIEPTVPFTHMQSMQVQAPIWNRSLIASLLYVSDTQLIELFIMLGSKFTEALGRKVFRGVFEAGLPTGRSPDPWVLLGLENQPRDCLAALGVDLKRVGADDVTVTMPELAVLRDWLIMQGEGFRLQVRETSDAAWKTMIPSGCWDLTCEVQVQGQQSRNARTVEVSVPHLVRHAVFMALEMTRAFCACDVPSLQANAQDRQRSLACVREAVMDLPLQLQCRNIHSLLTRLRDEITSLSNALPKMLAKQYYAIDRIEALERDQVEISYTFNCLLAECFPENPDGTPSDRHVRESTARSLHSLRDGIGGCASTLAMIRENTLRTALADRSKLCALLRQRLSEFQDHANHFLTHTITPATDTQAIPQFVDRAESLQHEASQIHSLCTQTASQHEALRSPTDDVQFARRYEDLTGLLDSMLQSVSTTSKRLDEFKHRALKVFDSKLALQAQPSKQSKADLSPPNLSVFGITAPPLSPIGRQKVGRTIGESVAQQPALPSTSTSAIAGLLHSQAPTGLLGEFMMMRLDDPEPSAVPMKAIVEDKDEISGIVNDLTDRNLAAVFRHGLDHAASVTTAVAGSNDDHVVLSATSSSVVSSANVTGCGTNAKRMNFSPLFRDAAKAAGIEINQNPPSPDRPTTPTAAGSPPMVNIHQSNERMLSPPPLPPGLLSSSPVPTKPTLSAPPGFAPLSPISPKRKFNPSSVSNDAATAFAGQMKLRIDDQREALCKDADNRQTAHAIDPDGHCKAHGKNSDPKEDQKRPSRQNDTPGVDVGACNVFVPIQKTSPTGTSIPRQISNISSPPKSTLRDKSSPALSPDRVAGQKSVSTAPIMSSQPSTDVILTSQEGTECVKGSNVAADSGSVNADFRDSPTSLEEVKVSAEKSKPIKKEKREGVRTTTQAQPADSRTPKQQSSPGRSDAEKVLSRTVGGRNTDTITTTIVTTVAPQASIEVVTTKAISSSEDSRKAGREKKIREKDKKTDGSKEEEKEKDKKVDENKEGKERAAGKKGKEADTEKKTTATTTVTSTVATTGPTMSAIPSREPSNAAAAASPEETKKGKEKKERIKETEKKKTQDGDHQIPANPPASASSPVTNIVAVTTSSSPTVGDDKKTKENKDKKSKDGEKLKVKEEQNRQAKDPKESPRDRQREKIVVAANAVTVPPPMVESVAAADVKLRGGKENKSKEKEPGKEAKDTEKIQKQGRDSPSGVPNPPENESIEKERGNTKKDKGGRAEQCRENDRGNNEKVVERKSSSTGSPQTSRDGSSPQHPLCATKTPSAVPDVPEASREQRRQQQSSPLLGGDERRKDDKSAQREKKSRDTEKIKDKEKTVKREQLPSAAASVSTMSSVDSSDTTHSHLSDLKSSVVTHSSAAPQDKTVVPEGCPSTTGSATTTDASSAVAVTMELPVTPATPAASASTLNDTAMMVVGNKIETTPAQVAADEIKNDLNDMKTRVKSLSGANRRPSSKDVLDGLSGEASSLNGKAGGSTKSDSSSSITSTTSRRNNDATNKVNSSKTAAAASRSTEKVVGEKPAAAVPPVAVLPIDAHRETILEHVNAHAVTIIHGMTGCGKSSRLPQMLLEDGEECNRHTQIMVSQPRRIAATALKNRLSQTIGEKVGLRLGNGVREESKETKLWFVTTGYLVRLMAHRMESFEKFSHLVIDEVHERSIDGDILCLLARRALEMLPHIKVILMSATVHTSLYRDYFAVQQDAIFVGVRRFPLQEIYCEELIKILHSSNHGCVRKLEELTSECAGYQGEAVSDAIVREQLTLAVALARQVATAGTAVLIFVSGMADITELIDKFERSKKTTVLLKLIAIHSDIPFEEQMQAFQPAASGEAKIVIATNAAESSLTLPDVDHVICLGTHKMLTYNDRNHAAQLVNCWISKASATQRAGRTGRMRPGTVYRLYSQSLFQRLPDHDLSEVHRQPLSEVILRLRVMLDEPISNAAAVRKDDSNGIGNEDEEGKAVVKTVESNKGGQGQSMIVFDGVVSVLMSLLEPPELENIFRSFKYLYDVGMISSPDDHGALTAMGKLAGQLPVDLILGRLIALGNAVDLGFHACIMAAALSLPKSPFRIASPIVHTNPDEYNAIVRMGFFAKCRLDRGHLSEPIMLLNALLEYRSLPDDQDRADWCRENCIAFSRMRQFNSIAMNLFNRMTTAIQLHRIDEDGHLASEKVDNSEFTNDDKLRKLPSDNSSKGAEPNKSCKRLHSLTTVSRTSRGQDVPILLDHSESLAVSHATANALRLVLFWALSRNLLSMRPPVASDGALTVARVPNSNVNTDMLDTILSYGTADASRLSAPFDIFEESADNSERSSRGRDSARQSQRSRTGSEGDSKGTSNLASQRAGVLASSLEARRPPIDWRLVAVGKRTYSGSISERSFEGLLSSFTECVEAMRVPVAWLHCKHVTPEKVILVVLDELANSIVEFLKNVFLSSGALEIYGSFGGFTVICATVSNSGSSGSSRGTSGNRSQRDREIDKLGELYSKNVSALSWTIPTSGPAVLVCANCMPTDEQIRSLFIGPPPQPSRPKSCSRGCQGPHCGCDSTNLSSSSHDPEYEDRMHYWLDWSYTAKTSRSKMQLEFSPDAPSALAGGGVDIVLPERKIVKPTTKNCSEEDTSGVSGIVEIPRYEILADLPLGLRLLNSIRFGSQSERCVRLIARGEGYEGPARHGRVVSIKIQTVDATWYCSRHLSSVSSSYGKKKAPFVIPLLTQSSKETHQQSQPLHRGSSQDDNLLDNSGKPRRAIMPTHSLQQVCLCICDAPVYAVTYTLTLIGDDAARAEGVTLLPLGKKWLALALECAGLSHEPLRPAVKDVPTTDEMNLVTAIRSALVEAQATITPSTRTSVLCDDVSKRGELRKGSHYNGRLRNLVDELFHDWTRPPHHGAASSTTLPELDFGPNTESEKFLIEFPALSDSSSAAEAKVQIPSSWGPRVRSVDGEEPPLLSRECDDRSSSLLSRSRDCDEAPSSLPGSLSKKHEECQLSSMVTGSCDYEQVICPVPQSKGSDENSSSLVPCSRDQEVPLSTMSASLSKDTEDQSLPFGVHSRDSDEPQPLPLSRPTDFNGSSRPASARSNSGRDSGYSSISEGRDCDNHNGSSFLLSVPVTNIDAACDGGEVLLQGNLSARNDTADSTPAIASDAERSSWEDLLVDSLGDDVNSNDDSVPLAPPSLSPQNQLLSTTCKDEDTSHTVSDTDMNNLNSAKVEDSLPEEAFTPASPPSAAATPGTTPSLPSGTINAVTMARPVSKNTGNAAPQSAKCVELSSDTKQIKTTPKALPKPLPIPALATSGSTPSLPAGSVVPRPQSAIPSPSGTGLTPKSPSRLPPPPTSALASTKLSNSTSSGESVTSGWWVSKK